MVDIYHIHNKTGISLRTLKRLDKHGWLKIDDPANPEKVKIEFSLRKNNPLTAQSALMLWKNPDWADELGAMSREANLVLKSLGDVEAEKMPWSIAAQLLDASDRIPEAVESMARWLRQHIDASPAYAGEGQGYSFVAVRVLADIPDHLLAGNLRALPSAISWMRKHPVMEGYSFTNEKKRAIFRKPLDL